MLLASSLKGGSSPGSQPHEVRHLHTIANMALQLTLMFASFAYRVQIARPDGSKACIAQLGAMWRRARLPCEAAHRQPIKGVDDFLMHEHWLAIFWVPIAAELLLAPTSARPMLVDPVREFPTIPMSISATALDVVRGQVVAAGADWNRPLPESLAAELEVQLKFVCADVLGWIDPDLGPTMDPKARDDVLQRFVSTFEHSGPLQLTNIFTYGFLRVSEYIRWVKEEVKLGPLDVLIAGELMALGTESQKNSSKLPKEYLQSLMANPLLPEAVRRSEYLRDALARMDKSVPASISAQFRDGDFAGMMNELSSLPGDCAAQVVGLLTGNRLVAMLLVSPEPFVDLAEEESESDMLLEAWFSLPSFFEASRNAIVISTIMRMFAAAIPGELERNKLFSFTCCFCATYSAWFHILVLRRFRSIVAGATDEERAQALNLYEDIRKDVEACLNVIDLSNHPDYLPVKTTLRAVLDGDSATLTEEDVRMLKLGQRAAQFCAHQRNGNNLGRDGTCYECLAERTTMGRSMSDASDPMADLGDVGAQQRRKSVKFAEEIEEGETWSAEDYARAKMSESPEAKERALAKVGGLDGNALAGLIQQRDLHKLPNLREFW